MRTKQFLSELMSQAWRIRRATGKAFAECLKKAWLNCKLAIQMCLRIVEFYFQKVDGTIRQAFGTLQPKYLPESTGSGRKKNDTCFLYFDTEKKEYRQFKIWNIIRIV